MYVVQCVVRADGSDCHGQCKPPTTCASVCVYHDDNDDDNDNEDDDDDGQRVMAMIL